MKKIVLLILMAAMVISVNSASAWQVNVLTDDQNSEWDLDYWVQVDNDSSENIIGFGVGISDSFDMTGSYQLSAPRPDYTNDHSIGYWWGYIVSAEAWNDIGGGGYGTQGNEITFQSYFGKTWVDLFGDPDEGGYDWGYVAVPDPEGEHPSSEMVIPGTIPGGTKWGSSHASDGGTGMLMYTDFGFRLDNSGIPLSPAFVLFEDSGTFIGQTNFSNPNPNPIPIPSTMFLLGIGLLGIAGVSRRRKYT